MNETQLLDSRWRVNRLTGSLAAEIVGSDINTMDEGASHEITALLVKHHVLIFRGQSLDNDGLMRFGRLFGELNKYPFKRDAGGAGAGIVMALKNDKFHAQTDLWHADATAWECPPSITILREEKLPEAGGDTLFANQHAAFDALSDRLKDFLRSLKAIHFYDYGAQGVKRQAHPAVRTHPVSRRESLYVSETFVSQFDGMTLAESRPILRFLLDHAVHPEFCYRHRWQKGDVVMWDNRSVLHRAIHDYGNDPEARLVCNVQTLCEPVM